jgi:hypothetical protein
VDLFQSVEAVFRYESHVFETLSPSCSAKGLPVRAQWYAFHE